MSAPWEHGVDETAYTRPSWTRNANVFNQTADARRNIKMSVEMQDDAQDPFRFN